MDQRLGPLGNTASRLNSAGSTNPLRCCVQVSTLGPSASPVKGRQQPVTFSWLSSDRGPQAEGKWEGPGRDRTHSLAPGAPRQLALAAAAIRGQARPSCSSLWPGWPQTLSPNPLLCSPRLSKPQDNFFFLNPEKAISKQTLKTVVRGHKNRGNVPPEGTGEVRANCWLGLACCLGVPGTPQQIAPSSLPWTLEALRNKSKEEGKTSPFLQIGASLEDKTLGQGSC